MNKMPALSKEFLEQLGIELDAHTYAAFTQHFETTLEARVNEAVIDALDEPQLLELTQLKSANNNQLQAWLQANVPDLTEIIQDEIDILLGELAENSDKI